jgi:hypothetical protein
MHFPSKRLEILLDPKQISGASHLLHSAADVASTLLFLLLCSASPCWQSLLTPTSAFLSLLLLRPTALVAGPVFAVSPIANFFGT